MFYRRLSVNGEGSTFYSDPVLAGPVQILSGGILDRTRILHRLDSLIRGQYASCGYERRLFCWTIIVPAVYSGFTGLAMAPISWIARYTTGYSRQLGLLMVTMSPGLRPIFTKALAVFLTILDSSLNVYRLSVSASI